jgi:hypothetical protein
MLAKVTQFWLQSFKIVLLGTDAASPPFFPRFKSTVEVIFLNAVDVAPSISFSICETKRNHRGLSPASREDGER